MLVWASVYKEVQGKHKGFPSLATDEDSGKGSPFWLHHLAEQEVFLLFPRVECDVCPCSHTFFFFVLVDTKLT